MHLADVPAGEQWRPRANFPRQRIEIIIDLRAMARDYLIAAAEVAPLVTERDMDIQRQRPLGITARRRGKRRVIILLAEFKRGGIRTYSAARSNCISE